MDNKTAFSLYDEKIPSITDKYTCPGCGNGELLLFYKVDNVPVHSCLITETLDEALKFPSHRLLLGFCNQCAGITNVAFNQARSSYSPRYEAEQCHSPTFGDYSRDLAQYLVDKYNLHNSHIVEIGCGKGQFLRLLCEYGSNQGVGIDPAASPGKIKLNETASITFIQEYYDERYAVTTSDFICCRHTLEHIHNTGEFMRGIRRSIGNRLDTVLFLELPDTKRILREAAFEDIYYEHCSYFTAESISGLLTNCGFEVIKLDRVYDGQYLAIEVRPGNGSGHPEKLSAEDSAQNVQEIISFSEKAGHRINYWKHILAKKQSMGERVVVWGAGSRCAAFIGAVNGVDKVDFVVDINPNLQGKYIPGLGLKIHSPEYLREVQVDHIIIMNSIYKVEIEHILNEMKLAIMLLTL